MYSGATGWWTLPQTLGYGVFGQRSTLGSWVGVQSDIPGGTILYQSGVAQDNYCVTVYGGYCAVAIYVPYAWYESPPNDPPHQITEVTVNEHDYVYVDVVALNATGDYDCNGAFMGVTMYNVTTSTYWSVPIDVGFDHMMACDAFSQYAEFYIENELRHTGAKFPNWIDDFFMFGIGWDDPGNNRPITDPNAENAQMANSNNDVMAYYWEDYYDAAILFQWYRWD